MQPEERDRIMARLLGCWPKPPLADSQMLVWNEHVTKMAYEPAMAAILWLEKNVKYRPALSEFHEAYAAQRHVPARALDRGPCNVCEDGWVQVRCVICNCGDEYHRADTSVFPTGRCPNGPGTAARCPNGCMPLSAAEREERVARQDDDWRRDAAHRQQVALDLRVDGVRDPSGPNDTEVF